MSIAERLRQYLVTELGRGNELPDGLQDDTPLLSTGIIDSLTVFDILAFLEHDLGVYVDDVELLPENFESIAAITRLAESKLGSADA